MDIGPATVIRVGWNPGLASGIDLSSGELTGRRDGGTPGGGNIVIRVGGRPVRPPHLDPGRSGPDGGRAGLTG